MLVKNTIITLLAVAPAFAVPVKLPKLPSSPKSPGFAGAGKLLKQSLRGPPRYPTHPRSPAMKDWSTFKPTRKHRVVPNMFRPGHHNNRPLKTHWKTRLPGGPPGTPFRKHAPPGLRISIPQNRNPSSPFSSRFSSPRTRTPFSGIATPRRLPGLRSTNFFGGEMSPQNQLDARVQSPSHMLSRRDALPSPVTPVSPYSPLSAMSMASSGWPMAPYSPLRKHRFNRQHKQLHKFTVQEALQMQKLLLDAERIVNGLEKQLNKPETKFKALENFKKGQARLHKMQRASHKNIPPQPAGDAKKPATPTRAS